MDDNCGSIAHQLHISCTSIQWGRQRSDHSTGLSHFVVVPGSWTCRSGLLIYGPVYGRGVHTVGQCGRDRVLIIRTSSSCGRLVWKGRTDKANKRLIYNSCGFAVSESLIGQHMVATHARHSVSLSLYKIGPTG